MSFTPQEIAEMQVYDAKIDALDYIPPEDDKEIDRVAFSDSKQQHKNAYARSWYHAHKEQVCAHKKRYRADHGEQVQERNHRYESENPLAIQQKNKRFYSSHKEEVNERCSTYYAQHKDEINAKARAKRALKCGVAV